MSDTVDQNKILHLLAQAMDLAPAARPPFLDRECRGDPALRQELDELLAEEEDLADDFLQSPAPLAAEGNKTRPESQDTELPKQLGRFKVLRTLGKGGMGTVYLAQQQEPVRRRVAVKVLDSMHDPRRQKRFAAEGQALARLSHPNVASFFELGATETGHPFVAMELVEGSTITAYVNQHRLELRRRLYLFLGVCAGVRHAHEKRILHRDLKPSNILVTEVDGRPTAKVIDFGIARTLDDSVLDDTRMTLDHHLVGSPAYMSPEAASFGRKDLDTRSDVYSLGLVLFEILVGVQPFDNDQESFSSLLRRVAEEQVPAASARFASLHPEIQRDLAARRGLGAETLAKRLSGDLDAILAKATALDREERYSSPADLAADLGRYLRNEPIEARPPTPAYLLQRFLRRRFGTVLAVSLLILALGAGFVARTLEAKRANLALAESEELSSFLIGLLEMSDPDKAMGETVTARDILDLGAEEVQTRFEGQPLTRARFLSTIGKIYESMGAYDRAEPLLRESLLLAESNLPAGDPELARKLHDLGDLYRSQGRYDEAEPLLRRSLDIRQVEPGLGGVDLADTLRGLGRVFVEQARYEEAEPYYQSALDTLENEGTHDRAALAVALDGLGAVHYQLGRLKQAEAVRSRALSIREEVLGPDHPAVATSLNNLGALFLSQDRLSEAKVYHQRALAIRERVLGPEHPHVASSLNNLGQSLLVEERYEEAEPLLARSLAIKRKTLEPNHPNLANSLLNLAKAHLGLDQPKSAEVLIREGLEIRAMVLGESNKRTLDARMELIRLLLEQKRHQEVEPLLEETLTLYAAAGAEGQKGLEAATALYSRLLKDTNRQAQAEALDARSTTSSLS